MCFAATGGRYPTEVASISAVGMTWLRLLIFKKCCLACDRTWCIMGHRGVNEWNIVGIISPELRKISASPQERKSQGCKSILWCISFYKIGWPRLDAVKVAHSDALHPQDPPMCSVLTARYGIEKGWNLKITQWLQPWILQNFWYYFWMPPKKLKLICT